MKTKAVNVLQCLALSLALSAMCSINAPALSADSTERSQASTETHEENQTYATTPDGIKIAIQEYGNPAGKPLVLIHGLLGSHLDWNKQISSNALKDFRIITYDMRGHGLSGKPDEPSSYSTGKLWGDDLATVIEATHAIKPVVVGWSLGGAVIINYLEQHGDKNLSGIYLIGAVTSLKPECLQPIPETHRMMLSSDLETSLLGIKKFVHLCFEVQPNEADFELLYANAARASSTMLNTIFTKGIDVPSESALPKVTVPARYLYGKSDALVNRKSLEFAQKLDSKLSLKELDATGHAPFFERPDVFNADLQSFVNQ